MSSTQRKVAAATTVTALGALDAGAMASTQSAPSSTAAPAAAAPAEVRVVVIGKTVQRTKAEPQRAVSASAAAIAVPSTPPVAPVARPASSLDAAPALFAAGSTAATTAQSVAYAAKRKPPRTFRARASGSRRRIKGAKASAAPRGYGVERRGHREIGDD